MKVNASKINDLPYLMVAFREVSRTKSNIVDEGFLWKLVNTKNR